MQPSLPKLSDPPLVAPLPGVTPEPQSEDLFIQVKIASQVLELRKGEQLLHCFPISSSALGLGHENGSNKTPTGLFAICQKVGHNAPVGMVFKSRIATGEIGEESDPADLVQTRILWLSGLEAHNANTRERFIYIHGTNHEASIGTPSSHGCIRMRNADVVTLFDLVPENTKVVIA